MPIDNIPSRLFRQADRIGDEPAYYAKREGAWQATTWARYADQVRRAARALIALEFKPGDTTCILGFNRPEWVIFDLATMAAGGAPAGTIDVPYVNILVDRLVDDVFGVQPAGARSPYAKAAGLLP